ncbi:peroxiredoxin-like family protein [Fulvivirgaceae bacterium BMA12]|uniref:thioredoxin-dependent peroxiredoxin n=1 Tax=Agaribacillus aureus TaxID=3051825 RepID=A0ABT8L8D4_9BACT|nr:peroxiredoxin-like family protein [Fulvivirgaceae bacterium BMA12]
MKTPINTEQQTTLKADLDARRISWEAKAPEAIKTIYQEGVLAVEQGGTTRKALQPGHKAIDFILSNANGNTVHLYEVLKQGPVVLTWYRGGWCPYCNITLRHLQQHLPDFKKAGANLIALTPELPDNSLSTQEKNQLQFEVLSDINNEVARKYGIVFKLTDEVADTYRQSFSLEAYNGNDNNELPLAATYVIDREGIIRYAFLDAEYRNRAEPGDILDVLKALK